VLELELVMGGVTLITDMDGDGPITDMDGATPITDMDMDTVVDGHITVMDGAVDTQITVMDTVVDTHITDMVMDMTIMVIMAIAITVAKEEAEASILTVQEVVEA